MKISQLSARSGVPVPTIKFYLRENLLDPGTPTSINQHRYDEEHLQRLRLIQALSQVGRLSIVQVRALLSLIETSGYPVHTVLGQTLIETDRGTYTTAQFESALGDIDALIQRYRWKIDANAPARMAAAAIVATLQALGDTSVHLDLLARHADEIAYADDPTESVEQALVGAVLGDRLLIALRRLAEENVHATTSKETNHG